MRASCFLSCIIVVLLAGQAAPWGPATNEFICQEAVTQVWGEDTYVNCFVSTRIEDMCALMEKEYQDECLRLTVMPWNIPDGLYRDFEKHHDYTMCPTQKPSQAKYLCSDRDDAPALSEAREWFTKSSNCADECRRVYAFCIGSIYYAKRYFQPYQLEIENQECAEHFKEKVDELVGNYSGWKVPGTCSYDFWAKYVGGDRKKIEHVPLVFNQYKIDSIIEELVVEGMRINTSEGEVGFSGALISSTSTTTLFKTTSTSTTTSSTTTTVSKDEDTTSSIASSTSTLNVDAKAKDAGGSQVEAGAEPDREKDSNPNLNIVLTVILVLLILFYLIIRKRGKKKPPKKEEEKITDKKLRKLNDIPMQEIKGIGKVAEDRLKSHGVSSMEALVTMDVEELCEKTGISEERIIEWKEKAKEFLS